MKTLTINEDQMTFLLKEFLKQYNGQFDHATYNNTPNGYLVHFHQSPEPPPIQAEETKTEEDNGIDDPLSYLPPLSIPLPDFGGAGFGGFGGGASGGAGATGDW